MTIEMKRKLCIVMVGLPARGKSTNAKKIYENLLHDGLNVKIFNNGDIRRKMLKENTSGSEFYNPDNKKAALIRESIALININNASDFLKADGEIAIIDAANVSKNRQNMIKDNLNGFNILFVECVNEQEDFLDICITIKTELSEFSHLPQEEAYDNFMKRIDYYKKMYNSIKSENNYIIVDSLNNRILYEKEKGIPYFHLIRDILVSDNVHNLFLVRHGETYFNVENRVGGDSELNEKGQAQAKALAKYFEKINVNYVFASTKKRTLAFANEIKKLKSNIEIIQFQEFDEIETGLCDSITYDELRLKMPHLYEERAKDKYDFVYPEGESYRILRDRVLFGMKKALYLSSGEENIVIIGHRAVNRIILSLFQFRNMHDVPYIYIPQDKFFQITATHYKKLIEMKKFI